MTSPSWCYKVYLPQPLLGHSALECNLHVALQGLCCPLHRGCECDRCQCSANHSFNHRVNRRCSDMGFDQFYSKVDIVTILSLHRMTWRHKEVSGLSKVTWLLSCRVRVCTWAVSFRECALNYTLFSLFDTHPIFFYITDIFVTFSWIPLLSLDCRLQKIKCKWLHCK